jgi:hypothetical protein
VALGDPQNDGAGLEEGQIAVLVGRDLAERLDRAVGGLLHLGEGHEATS